MTDGPLELTVERLTFGFDALAHDGRQVVFVPYGAPGDCVRAEVVERRKDWVRARPLAVLAPGPARVVPGCRYFPTCGGCQWQHVAPAAQREAKAALIAEHLARGAGVRDATVLPTVASPADWAYRQRITLVVDGRRLGYHRARSHTLLEIDACPIAAPALSAHLEAARGWAATLRTPVQRVTIATAPGGVALAGLAAERPRPPDHATTEDLLARTPSVRGAVLRGGGERFVIGDPTVRVALEPDLALEVPCDAFTQVNAGGNLSLVTAVLALGAFRAGERVLDLYAGAGNFTLPIARRGVHVCGVERDAVAVAAARANAARLALDATFTSAAARDALAAEAPGSVDAVVLDPPRTGAGDAIAPLAALRPARIVYVSCDPPTFARDVRALGRHGYRVGRVQPIDLFPQTFHVESVAELLLT